MRKAAPREAEIDTATGLSPRLRGERWRSRIGSLRIGSVLLLAALLRVWGLTWGLPSATHYFSYHPDESVVLGVAAGMNLFTGRMLPHFYDYPSLQIYLVNFANSLAFLFGAVDIVPKDLAVWYPQWVKMYLIGRCLTVAMGIGTVWTTYALGTRLWNRRAGLFAALLLAVMPLHAQHSHFLTVDVPATFWVTLSLLLTTKLALPSPVLGGGAGGHIRAALWAGLFAGLAAATKYNMALVLVPLVIACLHSSLRGRGGEPPASRGRTLSIGLLAATLAFLVGCPGAILESHRFLAGLRYEAVHVNNADDPTFKDTGSGFVYHITHNLDAGMGLPLLLLALASIAYALYRRERGDGLLAAFALPYYVLISLAAVRYARYVIPLLPILALWSGRLLADLSQLPRPALRRTAWSVGAGVAVLTLADCVLLLSPMAQADPRDQALAWLNANAPASAQIGFPVQPWFGTVPVSPYFAASPLGAWRAPTPPGMMNEIQYSGQDWDIAALQATKPPFVVLSEYDYRDALRLQDPAALAYLAALRKDYTLRRIFPREKVSFWGLENGLPVHILPHDMLYTNPEITIYQRK